MQKLHIMPRNVPFREAHVTSKTLLRLVKPHPSESKQFSPVLKMPLVAKSPTMRAFIKRCEEQAMMGHYLAIVGRAGDLLEAQALFNHLMSRLYLDSSFTALPGRERQGILRAAADEVDALFIPCAMQIPMGTQTYLADTPVNTFRLVMLCYPTSKDLNLLNRISPNLRQRFADMLQFPGWGLREEDHSDLLKAAVELAATQFHCPIDMNSAELKAILLKNWVSTAGMFAEVMEIARLRSQTWNAKKFIIQLA